MNKYEEAQRADLEEAMKNKKESDVSAIGQFGVGFYSSYMVSDTVEVTSKSADNQEAHLWKSNGKENYTIDKIVVQMVKQERAKEVDNNEA